MWINLTTCNRLRKTIVSMERLAETNFPEDSHLIIFDDHSDTELIDYLEEYNERCIPNLRTELVLNEYRLGCAGNIIESLYYCLSKTEDQYIIKIDSDTIYHPEWLNKLIESHDRLLENNASFGAISVFNAERTHGFIEGFNKEIGVKKTMGGFCVMFNRIILETFDFRKPLWQAETFDWNLGWASEKMGLNLYCTFKSYVEHMRGEGTHGDDGDHGRNFVGE